MGNEETERRYYTREEVFKEIVLWQYTLMINSSIDDIPDYNPKLTKADNARRRANIHAVEVTEYHYQKQFKER